MTRANVLITGACGLLGAHLVAMLSRRYDVVGVDRHPWWGDEPQAVRLGDLEAPQFLRDTVEATAPSILIHCAALANVDACEQDPAQAYTRNATLTRQLVRAVPASCLVVYLSTDGVFQGDTPFAREEDAPCPRTVYGRSKLQGEREVALATRNHLIVRTNFYGWSSGRKRTAGEWLYHALEAQQPVTLFTDFFFTPIYVVDFVERLIHLLEHPYRGLIHVAGRDRLSKHLFGMLMAEAGGFSTEAVRPGSLDPPSGHGLRPWARRRGPLERVGGMSPHSGRGGEVPRALPVPRHGSGSLGRDPEAKSRGMGLHETPLTAQRPKDMSLSSARFVQLTGIEAPDSRSGLARFLRDRGRPLSARFAASVTCSPRSV